MEWYSLLTPELMKYAYRSDKELAWPKEDALRVVNLLNEKDYRIIGIDTWLPTLPGPTPLIYDWNPDDAAPNGNLPATPEEFIEFFAWAYAEEPDDKSYSHLMPVFNIWAEPNPPQE